MTEITAEAQTGRMWDYLRGYHAVHHISIGLKSGLFEAIDEAGESGIKAADLAAQLDLHAPYIEVWCRTGYHYQLLEADEGEQFTLAPFVKNLLVETADPRNLAAYFGTTVTYGSDELKAYPEYFKTGGVHRFQEKGHDFSRHVGDTTAGFHAVVARRMLGGIPGMKERLEAGAKVLDVGCGVGGLACKVAEAWPNSTCVGVDIDPHGIEQAQENIAAAGLSERVEARFLSGGDLDEKDEFDLAIMFEVLHEIEAGSRPAVVAGVAQALQPGGSLFILDETYPGSLAELRDPSFNFAIQTQFNELVWGNIVPTKAEQTALFEQAGLREIAREQIGGIFTMLVAVKE